MNSEVNFSKLPRAKPGSPISLKDSIKSHVNTIMSAFSVFRPATSQGKRKLTGTRMLQV